MYRKKHLSLSVSAALGITSFMMVPNVALAQDQATDSDADEMIEEVIVTGSRIISQEGFGQTSPVAVVGMDDISSYGLTRVEDVLNNLPQIEASNVAFDSNGASGTASIDLRGLGTNRTLVLLNGRRIQPGGINTEAVDVNQIPTMMIERVEVLTGGASATYGADAVAGVVNFIMRRLDGVEFRAGYSAYQHNNSSDYMQELQDARGFDYPTGSTWDADNYNIEFGFGTDFADGRGNATVFATWNKQKALLQGDRDYSSCALGASATSCGGSGNAIVPNFAIYPFDDEGNLDGAAGVYTGLQPDGSLGSTTVYNYNPTNYYIRPQTRWTAGAFADFEINEHAVVYLETMLANNETTGQIAFSGTFFDEAYDLPVDNSLFPQAFQDSLRELFPGEDRLGIYIGKRNVEGFPRRDVLTYSSHRIVAGIKGVINNNWDYDISYMHSGSNSDSTYQNDFYRPAVQVAVDGEKCAADPNCIPYEVFTYQGVTREAAAALTGTAIAANRSQLDVFEAYVTGDTGWGFDAGNIVMAGGFYWQQTKYESLSDTVYENGDLLGQGGPRPSVGGTIRAKEIFVEANVPLVADQAWSQMMALDLAYRYSDYNTTGGNSTYRIGLDWQVNDPFRLRAGYNRAVRAPSVAELFSPQSIGLWTGVDPCAGSDPIPSAAECARTGVTAGQYGNISASPAGQYNALYGGNPELDVEKANTWTAGIVIDAMDTMQISVDWWQIKIKDTISNVFAEVSLDECIAGSDQLCQNINRGIGGSLWLGKSGYVQSTQQNIGTQTWSGVDLAWAWQLGDNWSFDLIGTYSIEKETTPLPDAPETAYDCQGTISPQCYPNPKWRHTANATYDSTDWWAVTARWRYFGEVDYDGTTDLLVTENGSLGRAINYFDLNAVFRFMDTNDVIVGVNNVFDKAPPLMGSTLATNGNTIVGFYDTLGRYIYANVTLRW
jgi:outer membrane receptor protein involved in Fe transport